MRLLKGIKDWYKQKYWDPSMQAIAKATGTHIGSWGTPEFRVTEALAADAPRNVQGGSLLINPLACEVQAFLTSQVRK